MEIQTALTQLLEILKYTLPAIVVLIASYMTVNKFLIKEIDRKRLSIFQKHAGTSLQLRLQAYERLTIFVERMHPTSLISRFYTKDASAQDVHLAMVNAIRAEYEHNMSQQIYVSNEVWQTIKTVMEQEIMMLNKVGASLAMGSTSQEFIRHISEFVVDSEHEMPTHIALEAINKEAKVLLIGH
ncbi:MAG: hypothetical protein R2831_01025 [Chitinophagaceae bacterium]